MSSDSSKKPGRPIVTPKRAAIIAAAGKSFLTKGFAATSIEQVAADAGVSKVTIYNHFGDKRALFAASVHHECAVMRANFAIEPAPAGTLRERLTAIGEAMVAFLSREELVRFDRRIAAETETEPTIGEAFLSAGPHRMRAAFAALLETMVAGGELDIAIPRSRSSNSSRCAKAWAIWSAASANHPIRSVTAAASMAQSRSFAAPMPAASPSPARP